MEAAGQGGGHGGSCVAGGGEGAGGPDAPRGVAEQGGGPQDVQLMGARGPSGDALPPGVQTHVAVASCPRRPRARWPPRAAPR